MLFFKLEYELEDPEAMKRRDGMRSPEMCRLLDASAITNRALWKQSGASFYIVEMEPESVTLCAAIRHSTVTSACTVPTLFEGYAAKIALKGRLCFCEEITFLSFQRYMSRADAMSLLEDEDDEYRMLGLESIRHNHHQDAEDFIGAVFTKAQAVKKAKTLLCAGSFVPEIERICDAHAPRAFMGHPVHYILSANSPAVMERMRALLLGTLLGNGRLVSKRFCMLDLSAEGRQEYGGMEQMLRSMEGGAMVYKLSAMKDDGVYADARREALDWMIRSIKKSRRNTLSIIEMDHASNRQIAELTEQLYGITLIHISEEIVWGDTAKGYLRQLAKEHEVRNARTLYAQLGEEESYTATDLERLFDKWYDDYLRTQVYAQYAQLAEASSPERAKPKGSAFSELSAMIGLTEAKRIILEAIDFHKAQKLFADKGFTGKRPAMHMVFYGNPGTAKTTVARLVAQIMKDNGLLREGRLIEVGRSDLVGKYVGWTAPTVKKYFKKAKGSVLFIDEAYALVDDRDGMYGDEAINAIVQEMENAREDTVVILAGYPDKMQGFIKKNPGLKSRIAFHVDFPDYTADELMQILRLMAETKQLSLTADAEAKAHEILSAAAGTPDFGNGRYVRNLLEKATLRQATRLMRKGLQQVKEQDVRTLLAEDLTAPQQGKKEERRAIGF